MDIMPIGALHNVAIVVDEELTGNIISIPQLYLIGYSVIFEKQQVTILDDKKRVVYNCSLESHHSHHVLIVAL